MGAVAELLPGALDLTDPNARAQITRAWKEELPLRRGATLIEMIDRRKPGTIKSLFVVGENPVGSLPPSDRSQRGAGQARPSGLPGTVSHGNSCARPCGAPGRSSMEKAGTFHQYRGPCPGSFGLRSIR